MRGQILDLNATGLAAVDRFITTWNSRDPAAWAASLNYPHARPSPFGPINISPTAEAYAAGVDYNRVIATGWDHSEWDYRHVLHISPSRIHVVGQWSRYNADAEIIHTNPITYIVTHHDNNWGIQSRFAADHAHEDEDTSGFETRGFKLVKDFIVHLNSGARESCAEMLNYPHITVAVGELDVCEEAAAFLPHPVQITLNSLVSLQVGHHSMNLALEVTVEDDHGTRELQGVMNLTNRDDHLGIQAWSFLDPHEPPPDD